jgi:hypothetical protein
VKRSTRAKTRQRPPWRRLARGPYLIARSLRVKHTCKKTLARDSGAAQVAGYSRRVRVTKVAAVRVCAICERTLLMGERSVRYAPEEGAELVDVCPLCQDIAVEHGWLKEGTPTTPTIVGDRRRRRRGLPELLGLRRSPVEETIAPREPILRRLSEEELALLEAADLFNGSTYRRTVGGIAKSLGTARASIVPLSGVAGEMAVTVAWDLSWYQYRVSPESAQPVRLERRGHELDELEESFKAWNARVEDEGRLVPEIARL